jgi:hypothetical protein
MSVLVNVTEITAVKDHLDDLIKRGLVKEWELPYEYLLTRLTAAIFFLTPADERRLDEIWTELEKHPMLQYSHNEEKRLSALEWRVEFNKGFSLS